MELYRKLKLNADLPLWLINAPDDCLRLFSGYTIKEKLAGNSAPRQLILFAWSAAELAHFISKYSGFITNDTLFWVCYPRKSGTISSDLWMMNGWACVFDAGFRGQATASLNDDWTGFRITKAPKAKASICDVPIEERKVDGIDFVKRTVTLPDDALGLVNKYAGMAAYFNTLSFTAKKEYVIGITESKRAETRIRRIEKMISDLQAKMHTRKK